MLHCIRQQIGTPCWQNWHKKAVECGKGWQTLLTDKLETEYVLPAVLYSPLPSALKNLSLQLQIWTAVKCTEWCFKCKLQIFMRPTFSDTYLLGAIWMETWKHMDIRVGKPEEKRRFQRPSQENGGLSWTFLRQLRVYQLLRTLRWCVIRCLRVFSFLLAHFSAVYIRR